MDPDLQALLALRGGDGDPGEERRGELLARLRNDDAFRKAYVAETSLLGKLRVVQSAEPRWLALEDRIGWSTAPTCTANDLADLVVRSALRRKRLRRTVRRATLGIAAIALLALGLVFFTRHGSEAVEARIELAVVVKAENIVWGGTDSAPAEGSILTAGRLRLTSGRLTLVYFSGVVLTVEGPADIELLSADRVLCNFGKLRTRVPHGAEGFTVTTDHYEIVDLGTEFAVNREPGGKSQVMVFEGDAAVSALKADGQVGSSVLVERRQAVEMDQPGRGIREIPPQADRFIPLGGYTAGPLTLQADYATAVLKSAPWGYWRFETMIDGRVPNEIPGKPGLIPVGGVLLDPPVAGNRTARFLPNDLTQAYRLDGFMPLLQADDYAIELWVQTDLTEQDAFGRNALASLIDRKEGKSEKHVAYLEFADRGRRSPHEPCSIRAVHRWPADLVGGSEFVSRRTVVTTLWHHLVGQKRGDVSEVYIDGELIASAPIPRNPTAVVPKIECVLLVGRLKSKSVSPSDYQIRAFQGRIDELAVYDHALSTEDVRSRAKRIVDLRR